MLLAIDRLTDHDLRQCDLRFFLNQSNVEWVDLGQSTTTLQRVSVGGTALFKLMRDVRKGRYTAIVFGAVEPLRNPRKSPARNLSRTIKYLVRDRAAIEKIMLHRLLTARPTGTAPPIAGVDIMDRMVLDNSRFPVLSASTVYFKRELPQNVFNSFSYTSDKAEESSNTRRQHFFAANAGKLRPCSIGIPDKTFAELRGLAPEKTSDVFYAGNTLPISVRESGLPQLLRLRDEGYRVDIPEQRISKDEFLKRASQALVCWSAEGHGYECFRTYEVAAAGSVPLMNYPTIWRHKPFHHGVDGLYYGVEEDSLYTVVRSALEDRPRLAEMGRRARDKVAAHHTYSALAKHIVETALEPRPPTP